MKIMNFTRGKKGFTLVEIIIVLVILAILAAMLIPALTGYIDKAAEADAVSEAKGAFTAAQTTLSEYYATNPLDVTARITKKANPQKLNGEGVGRISNHMLNKMQGIHAVEADIIDTYGYDAMIAIQILKYLDSYNISGDQRYKFPDSKRIDNYTPKDYHKNSKCDIGVMILYNASGKIVFFQMIKGDYLVTIFDGKVKAEKDVKALNCNDNLKNISYSL